MKQVECVDVVARRGEKFVVIERLTYPQGLAWPGGKVDNGETVVDAVFREFREETGFVLAIKGFVGVYDDPKRDPRGRYVSTVFNGNALGAPKAEIGKTRVLELTKEEIEERRSEFIADHYQMFCDFLKKFCQ